MAATADIFYCYKTSIVPGLFIDDNYKPLNQYEGLNFDLLFSGDDCYLITNKNEQHFDWDYGLQPLSVDKLTADMSEENTMLRRALDLAGYSYEDDSFGWFVLCDYS